MSTYKLTYFNFSGLGEAIRYLLHQSGIKFEDNRIDYDEWPNYDKSIFPMRQMPILQIDDGKVYHQSKAIARFVAKKGNLYGSNDIEALEIDIVINDIAELILTLSLYFWEKDPSYREKRKQMAYEKFPMWFDNLEAKLKKNGGYFVGGKVSWPDLQWAAHDSYLTYCLGPDLYKDHPELKKLVDKVHALTNIKAYIEKRPKCIF